MEECFLGTFSNSLMGVFHFFKDVQMVPNCRKCLKCFHLHSLISKVLHLDRFCIKPENLEHLASDLKMLFQATEEYWNTLK